MKVGKYHLLKLFKGWFSKRMVTQAQHSKLYVAIKLILC